jgi:hypothetical protein
MNIKRINIQDILDESNSYFHFTDESNLYDNEQGVGILNKGLSSIPRNRTHTVGDDKKNPCIYFVQGYGGILELMDVWIRYEYSKLAMKDNYPPGYISVDEEGMNKVYQIWYEELKHSKYLKLELQAGDDPKTSDFNPSEEDLKKKKHFRQSIYHDEDTVDDPLYKWNYAKNTNYRVATVDRWNMTTHLNHEGEKIIPPEKITIMQDSRGRTDALSVILEIYENYRNTVSNVYDLDKFIQYIIEKEHKNNITFQEIGKKTVKSFSQNQKKAMEAMDSLENGVKMQEKVKEEKTQEEG